MPFFLCVLMIKLSMIRGVGYGDKGMWRNCKDS